MDLFRDIETGETFRLVDLDYDAERVILRNAFGQMKIWLLEDFIDRFTVVLSDPEPDEPDDDEIEVYVVYPEPYVVEIPDYLKPKDNGYTLFCETCKCGKK